jgi:hypothetical protein
MDQINARSIITMIQNMKATQLEVWKGLLKSKLMGLNSDKVLIESKSLTCLEILSMVLSAVKRWVPYFSKSNWREVKLTPSGSWLSSRESRLSSSWIMASPRSDRGSVILTDEEIEFLICSCEVS